MFCELFCKHFWWSRQFIVIAHHDNDVDDRMVATGVQSVLRTSVSIWCSGFWYEKCVQHQQCSLWPAIQYQIRNDSTPNIDLIINLMRWYCVERHSSVVGLKATSKPRHSRCKVPEFSLEKHVCCGPTGSLLLLLLLFPFGVCDGNAAPVPTSTDSNGFAQCKAQKQLPLPYCCLHSIVPRPLALRNSTWRFMVRTSYALYAAPNRPPNGMN